jgi:glycosyltransferase involved in cell wall biosynthesis
MDTRDDTRARQASIKDLLRVMDLRGTYKAGGGPDKTILNSAAQHNPERVHILVTYLKQPWDHEFQIEAEARRLGINYVDVEDRRRVDFKCLIHLKRLLSMHSLNIVHTHDDKSLLYAWLLSNLLPELKVIHTCHSHATYERNDFVGLNQYLTFKARQRMQVFLMRKCAKPIITVSCDTRKRLLASGLNAKDVTVLYNGIDLTFWRHEHRPRILREELAIPPGNYLIGTVARITYDKDLPTFFRVVEEVHKQINNVTFVIVGDGYGDELQKARKDVSSRGLDHLVRFTGHRQDLREVYASFDLFLMTSRSEGMPNTLLESMALGVPPISTTAGGIPEIIQNGITGFLSPVGNAQELAAHVVRLIADPTLRARLGTACQEHVHEHFSFSERVRKMEEYYAWFSGHGPIPDAAMHQGKN